MVGRDKERGEDRVTNGGEEAKRQTRRGDGTGRIDLFN